MKADIQNKCRWQNLVQERKRKTAKRWGDIINDSLLKKWKAWTRSYRKSEK